MLLSVLMRTGMDRHQTKWRSQVNGARPVSERIDGLPLLQQPEVGARRRPGAFVGIDYSTEISC